MNLGVPEIILILVVALLFFGPSRLPSLGKSVGEAIRGFKKGLSGPSEDDKQKLTEARHDVAGHGQKAEEKKKDTSEV